MSSITDTQTVRPFSQHDRMRDLIRWNQNLLPVLSRFDIALGFGESTVGDVCRRDNVDTQTFLTVCNFFSNRRYDASKLSLPSLVGYLKNSHRFFLDYVLPTIRSKLITVISTGVPGDFTWMLIKFYDDYVEEVRRHMRYEEENVFEYVLNLSRGLRDDDYSIATFKENHLPIAEKLRDLKELFIGHYTAEHGRVDLLNTVLFDIMTCERDLMLHCALEDHVFIPFVVSLENKVDAESYYDENMTGVTKTDLGRKDNLDEHGDIILTSREKDIVAAIAMGLSNKEIADKLFLSVHTVTTHRRNISSKLNIHSPAGLTVYAIMHGIIKLNEIKL